MNKRETEFNKSVLNKTKRVNSFSSELKSIIKNKEVEELFKSEREKQQIGTSFETIKNAFVSGKFPKERFKEIRKNVEKKLKNQVHYADCLITYNGKHLVLKRNQFDDMFPNQWCLPGGHVDPNEDSKTAALRETEEETLIKIDADNDFFEKVHELNNDKAKICYYNAILTGYPEPIPVLNDREHIEYRWVTDNELFELDLIADLKTVLEAILKPELSLMEQPTTNKIKGGLGDNKSIKQISEKHSVEVGQIVEQLKMGIGVEMEHTDDVYIATEIAMDHLMESPEYYTKLAEMESTFEEEGIEKSHKYLRKEPDGKGGFNYIYKEGEQNDKKEVQEVSKEQREKNFKEWFGNSKVVDENGKPLVVYHGTGGDFSEFSKEKVGSLDHGYYGRGFYFSKFHEHAENYATNKRYKDGEFSDGSLLPVFLKIENPFIVEKDGSKDLKKLIDKLNEGIEKPFTPDRSEYKYDSIFEEPIEFEEEKIEKIPYNIDYTSLQWKYGNSKKVSNALIELGYDGIVVDNMREIVVFQSNQIKSAIGNNGSFNPDSNDITKHIDSFNIIKSAYEQGKINKETFENYLEKAQRFYKDNAENKRLKRVGKTYGSNQQEDASQSNNLETKEKKDNKEPEKTVEEYAKESSDKALQTASQGVDEELRVAAKKEIERRETEHKPEEYQEKLKSGEYDKDKDGVNQYYDKFKDIEDTDKLKDISEFTNDKDLKQALEKILKEREFVEKTDTKESEKGKEKESVENKVVNAVKEALKPDKDKNSQDKEPEKPKEETNNGGKLSLEKDESKRIGSNYILKQGNKDVGHLETKEREKEVEIMKVKLNEESRGKGLYSEFLIQLIKEKNKPIVSQNIDRNDLSNNVWEKLKKRSDVVVTETKIGGSDALKLELKSDNSEKEDITKSNESQEQDIKKAIETLELAFIRGQINKEQFEKSMNSHKYIKKVPNGKGGFTYIYKEEEKENLFIDNKTGNFNEKLEDYANRIIKGEIHFDRLSQEEEKGRIEGSRRNVEASILCTAIERTNGENSEIEQRQVLRKYAKDNSILFHEHDEMFKDYAGRGAEAKVYYLNKEFVVKIVDYSVMHQNPLQYLDRISLHNYLFPETNYELIGFVQSKDSSFNFVVKQPVVKDVNVSLDEEITWIPKIEEEMLKMGMVKVADKQYVNENYIIDDIHTGNAVVSNDMVFFIDPIVSLNIEGEGYGGVRKLGKGSFKELK